MAKIASMFEEISKLNIHEMRDGRPLLVTKVIRDGGVTVFVGKNGKLYSPNIKEHHYYQFGSYPFTGEIIKLLGKMHIISESAANEHYKKQEAANRKRNLGYAMDELESLAKQYHFKITKEQKNKLTFKEEN